MKLDVVYLAKGRKLYTELSFEALLQNTDWSLVNRLIVYDDGSPTRDNAKSILTRMLKESPVRHEMFETKYGSPVAVMNDYLTLVGDAEVFAKIDNDIVVPPGWLEIMASTLERHPKVKLLGMQAGMSKEPKQGWHGQHSVLHSSHIGGVGLMRVGAFERYGRPVPDGRFGFTEWQHKFSPGRGWIKPDIRMFDLCLLPFEPWLSIAKDYQKARIQREWPLYDENMNWYWEWYFE